MVRLLGQAFVLREAGNMPALMELRIRACDVRGSFVAADNVASIAAFQPVLSLATYAATQTYVLSLTESLAKELRGTGVTVTALCPGLTASDMLSIAQRESGALRKLPRFVVGEAVAVAAEGIEACMAGKVIRVPGALNLAATLVGRATPRWLLRCLSGAPWRANSSDVKGGRRRAFSSAQPKFRGSIGWCCLEMAKTLSIGVCNRTPLFPYRPIRFPFTLESTP
jgi:NAD(P)-dependent dehydrogenase (short-subunit alcohol dehydrogenase family)